jgi:alpha-beta hydrolase superfamily lysophospholipase
VSSSAPRASPVITSDRVWLSTLMYGSPHAEVAVVFGHGFTGSQHNRKVVSFVRHLAESGLAAYTADFRGHGTSGGLSTLGDREVRDLDALVALARGRHSRVVSVGASMGAFVALRHAGLGGQVDAVIAISSPAVGHVPQLPRARLLGTLAGTERGRRLLDRYGTRVDPQQAPVASPPLDLAAEIAPIPVAIVHGRRDRYVPVSDAYALYERLGEPRRLVVLPSFGHGEAGFSDEFAVMLEELIADLLRRAQSVEQQIE